MTQGFYSVKSWWNLPISCHRPDIFLIFMHVLNLVKILWYLLKLSSGNENMNVSLADNSVKFWRNLPISQPKPNLYNINAHTKFGKNPWRVASGPRVKLASCKSALKPPAPPPPAPPFVCSPDRSKAVVPVLVLLFVALWFILRSDRLPRLGKRELI